MPTTTTKRDSMRRTLIELLKLDPAADDSLVVASVKLLVDAESGRQKSAAWERRIAEKTRCGLRREEAIESIQNQDAEDSRRLKQGNHPTA